MIRRIAVAALLAACGDPVALTGAVDVAAADAGAAGTPRWSAGQRWLTHVHRRIASQEYAPHRFAELAYEVAEVEPDGTVRVEVQIDIDLMDSRIEDYVTLRFDDAGILLDFNRLGYRIDPWRTDHHMSSSLLPGALLFWPSFPLDPGDRDGIQVRRDGEIFRLDAALGANPEAEIEQLRAHVQWEEGRPWHEFMRIDSVNRLDETGEPRVEFMELLVMWDPPKLEGKPAP